MAKVVQTLNDRLGSNEIIVGKARAHAALYVKWTEWVHVLAMTDAEILAVAVAGSMVSTQNALHIRLKREGAKRLALAAYIDAETKANAPDASLAWEAAEAAALAA